MKNKLKGWFGNLDGQARKLMRERKKKEERLTTPNKRLLSYTRRLGRECPSR